MCKLCACFYFKVWDRNTHMISQLSTPQVGKPNIMVWLKYLVVVTWALVVCLICPPDVWGKRVAFQLLFICFFFLSCFTTYPAIYLTAFSSSYVRPIPSSSSVAIGGVGTLEEYVSCITCSNSSADKGRPRVPMLQLLCDTFCRLIAYQVINHLFQYECDYWIRFISILERFDFG